MTNLEEQKLKHKNKIEFLKKLGTETRFRNKVDEEIWKLKNKKI